MPIKSAPYYWAECDTCGVRAEYDEFSALETAEQAEGWALESGWTSDGDAFRCPDWPGCAPLAGDTGPRQETGATITDRSES